MATLTKTSRNPFRTNLSTPNTTGTSPPSSGSGGDGASDIAPSAVTPTVTLSPPPGPSPPSRNEDPRDPDGLFQDEPPPYSANPSYAEGETVVEQGPARPFQPAPPRPGSTPSGWDRVQNHVIPQNTGSSSFSSRPGSGRSGSLFQQLSDTINTVVNSLNHPPPATGGLSAQPTGQSGWSAYPGQQQRPPQAQFQFSPPPGPPVPPPRHPLSPSASTSAIHSPPPNPPMRRHSSEFAHDFYAAGSSEGSRTQGNHATSSGSPPTGGNDRHNSIPDDGRPTERPVAGHPLLKDGQVLVYPKGHQCNKCHNVGYKDADPARPCTKCWNKYAKQFSGPLAYSFSPSSSANNIQRPLPHPPPRAPTPPPMPPRPASYAQGGYMPNHQGSSYPSAGGYQSAMSRPPPGSIVYTAGDPRIGGQLCWRCNGKGNVSFFLLERITCDICGGIGRTFN